MKFAFTILIICFFLITFASAQLGYNNPKLPKINPPAISTTSSSGGGGGNVTSVTSSTNCITVSPTTGNVVLTFNTSCSSSSTGGDFFFANFTNSFNINLSAALPLRNRTISDITNITNFNFNYNQTSVVFLMQLLNDTIRLEGLRNGLNSTFNLTYNNMVGQSCSPGQFVNGTLTNGTLRCGSVTVTGGDFFFANFTSSFNLNFSAINLGNRSLVHCSNVTGNGLCTTNQPSFSGANFTTTSYFHDAGIGARWFCGTILGGAIELGCFTGQNGFMQFLPTVGVDAVFGDTGVSAFAALATGEALFNSVIGFKHLQGQIATLQSNVTQTQINGNRFVINGTYIEANDTKKVSFPLANVSSLHQRYNITANTALDTTYNNSFNRPVYLDITIEVQTSTTDVAYATLYANGTYISSEGWEVFETGADSTPASMRSHFGGYIQPGERWSINSTIGGTGSVTIERVFLTAI